MQTARSGRLFSAGALSAEFVLLVVPRGCVLDVGVSNAVLAHLEQQCNPESVTRVRFANNRSDFDSDQKNDRGGENGLSSHQRVVEVENQVGVTSFWDGYIWHDSLTSGQHLVVLDTLRRFEAQSIARTLHDARKSQCKVIFVAVLHASEFEESRCEALRSLASCVVQIRQMAAPNAAVNRSEFCVWDIVELRVTRRKASGRVNVDIIEARFDSSKGRLLDVAVRQPSRDDGAVDADELRLLKTLNLPFKVALSNDERAARAAVALPFVHQNSALADSALGLHPESLRVVRRLSEEQSTDSDDSSSGIIVDEDGDELFSEDV